MRSGKRAFAGKAAYERFISRNHSIMQFISEISDLRWVTEREWQELSQERILKANKPCMDTTSPFVIDVST